MKYLNTYQPAGKNGLHCKYSKSVTLSKIKLKKNYQCNILDMSVPFLLVCRLHIAFALGFFVLFVVLLQSKGQIQIKKYGELLQKSCIYVYDPILDLQMF
jgi:hypothetical protein